MLVIEDIKPKHVKIFFEVVLEESGKNWLNTYFLLTSMIKSMHFLIN